MCRDDKIGSIGEEAFKSDIQGDKHKKLRGLAVDNLSDISVNRKQSN